MFKRLRLPPISFASRRDVLLMSAATLAVFAITTVWGVLLAGNDPFRSQNISKYFLLLVFFAFAAVVGLLPYLTRWGRGESHRLARLFVRVGIALQLFSIVASVIGLLYATDPIRSVPVGFATFTAMLFGLFAAGLAANSLAPSTA